MYIYLLIFIILFASFQSSHKQSDDYINTLLRQSARWSIAAHQDKNPLIAVLHANYGAAYLWALKDIATDTEITNATQINIKEFQRKIVNIQDQTTRKMAKLCPPFAGNSDKFLATIAGEN